MSMYLSKKSNIPGTSKLKFWYHEYQCRFCNTSFAEFQKLGTNTLQVSGSNYYDPDSISPVCALVFIGMIVVEHVCSINCKL